MKNSIKILFLTILLLVFASYTMALDCGFESPTNNGILSFGNPGSIINVSFSNSGTTQPSITVFVNISSPSTSNSSSLSLLFSQANTTEMTLSSVNISFSPPFVVVDSSDYTLSCACSNSTTRVNCNSTRTNIVFDTSIPSINGLTTIANGTSTSAQTITFGIANATRYEVREAGRPTTIFGLTGTLTNYSLSYTITPSSGGSYFVRAFDGLNSTDSSTITYKIVAGKLLTSPKIVTQQQTITQQLASGKINNSNIGMLILIFGSAIAFIIIIIIVSVNKRHKKR